MKLEVVVVPVSDVDRAKQFYARAVREQRIRLLPDRDDRHSLSMPRGDPAERDRP
jgi:hypothetical protein